MENFNFFLYDLLPKFLLGGIICVVAFGILCLIMEFIDNIIPVLWIGFAIIIFGCLLIIFPMLFYTIGDAAINGTFWEWVNGMAP